MVVVVVACVRQRQSYPHDYAQEAEVSSFIPVSDVMRHLRKENRALSSTLALLSKSVLVLLPESSSDHRIVLSYHKPCELSKASLTKRKFRHLWLKLITKGMGGSSTAAFFLRWFAVYV